MNEKEKKNEKMINVSKEPTKNMKIKKDWEETFEERSEFEYDDVRGRQYKKFKCADIHNVLY